MTEIREACPFCGGERIMRAKGGGRMSYDGFGDTNFRCGWLEAENTKLREQLEAAHLSRLLTETENESLRELLTEIYEDQCADEDKWKYRDRMRELEVDE